MSILVTIAARGGSKGVPSKNIRTLAGLPLIAHTIAQARAWGRATHIVVTTDSKEIAECALRFGAEVPFMRPAEYATDTASKFPALRHALVEMERLKGVHYEAVVDLDPTAPVRKRHDLDACLEIFQREKLRTLFSVVTAHKNPYFNLVEVDGSKVPFLSKGTPGAVLSRQQAPAVYAINGGIYVFSRAHLLSGAETSLTDHSRIYVMDDFAGVDIDREIDFKFLEFLIEQQLWDPRL